MKGSFLGYERAHGNGGIRNKVLLLPVDRYSNQLAWNIDQLVNGLARFNCAGDFGRHARDRERLFNITRGYVLNPNVADVIQVCVRRDFNYPETRVDRLLESVSNCGKPVETLVIHEAGGLGPALLEGERLARSLVRKAALQQRRELPLSQLTVGIKCGVSDGTSGISGNPSLGAAMDLLVESGGTVIFSETTEIIGAETLLADRASDPANRQRLLEMVARTEALAKSVGEDIRSINPIPSNIRAGITTLEEKSLGAIAKGGTSALRGVLEHGRQPSTQGLHFMDGWMAGNSLPIGLAAAGAQLVVFQSGGGDLPDDPPVPAINPAIISPLLFMTGNPQLAARLKVGLDFDASAVLRREATLAEIGEALVQLLADTASGQLTWGETQRYIETQEVWFDGPYF